MKKNLLRGNMREMSMLIALIIIIVLFSILTKGTLLRPMNIANLINQNAYVVILACGMLLCILTGGNIDLSVGSTVALVGACAGTFIITWKWNPYLSILLCLLVGIGLCYLDIGQVVESFSLTYLLLCGVTVLGAFFGAAIVGKLVGFYPVESVITAGLCMSNMGGTGDVAVLSAADRMELMPFAQISSRLGGAIILLLGSLLLSTLGGLL